MLAKIWKKLLLAICIIACLYNIMYKLITRTSLESQLRSVQNQTSIIDLFNKQENDEKIENDVVEDTTQNTENTTKTTPKNESNNSIVVIY